MKIQKKIALKVDHFKRPGRESLSSDYLYYALQE